MNTCKLVHLLYEGLGFVDNLELGGGHNFEQFGVEKHKKRLL